VFLGRVTATFNASGVAEAVVGPSRAREKWQVKQQTSTTTSTSQTTLTVRRYNASGPRLDFTRRANGDVSDSQFEVPAGQSIYYGWTGGTVGTVATCDIEGEREFG
jgi:hypothetical protein